MSALISRFTGTFKEKINSEDKKRLLSNFISLSVLQGANYLLPLITLPYLVRVLGAEKFGLIMFAQAFIMYFVILTDYGFNLSATREISINRENKEKVSEIFSSVMTIKFILLILSFILLSIIIFSINKFKQDWIIYYLTFGMVIGQVLFPIWFFQGMERMKYITFLNIISKLIFTISIFIFIHQISDYVYVPLINSLGFIVAGIIALWIILKEFKLKIYIPTILTLAKYLKDSSQFFLSRVSVSIYTATNAFILGLLTNNTMVGYYSIAEKLYLALQQVYQPIVNTLYPYVAHKKNVNLYKKIFRFVSIANFSFALILFLLAYPLINIIFGEGLEISANIFRILLLSAIVVVPSILLGYPFLAAMGYPKYANISVIMGSILHLIGLGMLLLLNMINVYTVAIMVVITETFVLCIRIYGVIKNNLWGV